MGAYWFSKGGIIAAKKLGHNDAAIAKVIGCHRTTVLRFFTAYESKKSPQKRSGRPRILNQQDRLKLKTSVTANKKLRQNLKKFTKTISKAKNLEKQFAVHFMKKMHSFKKASHFADWKNVIWSDESTFKSLCGPGMARTGGKIRSKLYRNNGEAFIPQRMLWHVFLI